MGVFMAVSIQDFSSKLVLEAKIWGIAYDDLRKNFSSNPEVVNEDVNTALEIYKALLEVSKLAQELNVDLQLKEGENSFKILKKIQEKLMFKGYEIKGPHAKQANNAYISVLRGFTLIDLSSISQRSKKEETAKEEENIINQLKEAQQEIKQYPEVIARRKTLKEKRVAAKANQAKEKTRNNTRDINQALAKPIKTEAVNESSLDSTVVSRDIETIDAKSMFTQKVIGYIDRSIEKQPHRRKWVERIFRLKTNRSQLEKLKVLIKKDGLSNQVFVELEDLKRGFFSRFKQRVGSIFNFKRPKGELEILKEEFSSLIASPLPSIEKSDKQWNEEIDALYKKLGDVSESNQTKKIEEKRKIEAEIAQAISDARQQCMRKMVEPLLKKHGLYELISFLKVENNKIDGSFFATLATHFPDFVLFEERTGSSPVPGPDLKILDSLCEELEKIRSAQSLLVELREEEAYKESYVKEAKARLEGSEKSVDVKKYASQWCELLDSSPKVAELDRFVTLALPQKLSESTRSVLSDFLQEVCSQELLTLHSNETSRDYDFQIRSKMSARKSIVHLETSIRDEISGPEQLDMKTMNKLEICAKIATYTNYLMDISLHELCGDDSKLNAAEAERVKTLIAHYETMMEDPSTPKDIKEAMGHILLSVREFIHDLSRKDEDGWHLYTDLGSILIEEPKSTEAESVFHRPSI